MKPHLYYFKSDEFREWWGLFDPRLLVLLDAFRHRWGAPVKVSPVDGALGRELGPDADSQHNADRWGEVRAVDLFPDKLSTRADAGRALRYATQIGLTGVGIYPDWRPSPGLHLDVRRGQRPGYPATWGAVRDTENAQQRYVSFDAAVDKLPED